MSAARRTGKQRAVAPRTGDRRSLMRAAAALLLALALLAVAVAEWLARGADSPRPPAATQEEGSEAGR